MIRVDAAGYRGVALNPQHGSDLPSPVVPPKSSPSALRRVLRRARDGVALNVDEAAIAMTARGEDLADLCASAARVRDAGLESAGRRGATGRLPVSYSRKVFIPVTHLCRDTCHYCTFVTVPGKLRAEGKGMFMEPDEILDVARRGAEFGCKEALFTLGDRPEARWDEARQWLDERGYDSTLDYVRAMAIRVLEETGLLPHLNPGVMSWTELSRLKPVAPSMGMMLETTSRRLFETQGSGALRQPGQGSRGAAAHAGRRRPTLGPVHHRTVGGHRRDADRAGRDHACDPQVAQGVRARAGSHRAELPGQGPHRDGHGARRRDRRLPGHRRGDPPGAGPEDAHPGAAEPGVPRGVPGADRRRCRRLGWRVAADARSRQPGAAVAQRWTIWPRSPPRRATTWCSASPRSRSTCRPVRRGSIRGCAGTSTRWPIPRPGWPAT